MTCRYRLFFPTCLVLLNIPRLPRFRCTGHARLPPTTPSPEPHADPYLSNHTVSSFRGVIPCHRFRTVGLAGLSHPSALDSTRKRARTGVRCGMRSSKRVFVWICFGGGGGGGPQSRKVKKCMRPLAPPSYIVVLGRSVVATGRIAVWCVFFYRAGKRITGSVGRSTRACLHAEETGDVLLLGRQTAVVLWRLAV